MPLWLFIFLGVLAIIAAFGVILQRSPVHCLLALAFALADIGALFIGLGAETVGFLQIIIYVGAIMILFLFVIWLLNLQAETDLEDARLSLEHEQGTLLRAFQVDFQLQDPHRTHWYSQF